MSAEVAERICRAIRERGPITFDEFMDDALYGEGGFYERTPVGPEGDFVTSPHVQPVFSRLVGAAIEELWTALGRPEPLRVVEVGAGDGTMARELIAGFERGGIDLEYAAIEVSSGARESLSELTPLVARELFELEPLDPGIVVANELLDNLPFRRVRRRRGQTLEVRIGLVDDRLVEVEAPCDAELAALAPTTDEELEATVPVGAFRFVDALAETLRTGYALLIDYGSGGRFAGAVHAYRGHRVLEAVLERPGSADITAGVDFGAVADRARRRGLVAFEPVTQSHALVALGFEEWMRSELAEQGTLLNAARGVEALRTWEGRNRARLLVHPSALGRHLWLLVGTSGLPEPDWLRLARDRSPAAD